MQGKRTVHVCTIWLSYKGGKVGPTQQRQRQIEDILIVRRNQPGKNFETPCEKTIEAFSYICGLGM